MQPFEGKWALVTGGSSGIGRAIARLLAAAGAGVLICGRDEQRLKEVVAELREFGDQSSSLVIDLRAADAHTRLAAAMKEGPKRLDILVHGAGWFSRGDQEHTPVEDLDLHYEINTRAPYLLTQALMPLLRDSRGEVVFVNSSIIAGARAGVGAYGASKHALRAIADSLRGEVNKDGVRVLSLYPGRTATPMQEKVVASEGKDYVPDRLLQPADIAQIVIAALQLPRTAEVTDIHIRPMQPA